MKLKLCLGMLWGNAKPIPQGSLNKYVFGESKMCLDNSFCCLFYKATLKVKKEKKKRKTEGRHQRDFAERARTGRASAAATIGEHRWQPSARRVTISDPCQGRSRRSRSCQLKLREAQVSRVWVVRPLGSPCLKSPC